MVYPQTELVYSAWPVQSPYIYEDGVAIAYDHTRVDYECRNKCVSPQLHAQVEAAMMNRINEAPSTTRVRLAKVAKMMGEEVDIKRLANE